jgi:ribosomal protein L11 methyltransferase
MPWFEIAIAVPAALVDEAAALLDFAGFDGVEVRPKAADLDHVDVVVYVEAGSESAAAELGRSANAALEILGGGNSRIVEIDPRIWTENWKKHFARRSFAGRIEVLPPWEQPSPASEGLLSIVINPGMAFGTGLHETTASCIELLVAEMKPGIRVADVGCGSGILSIAAARLGASEVLATDIDPLAVDASGENIAANGVAAIVRVELEPEEDDRVPDWEREARPGLTDARRGGDAPRALSSEDAPSRPPAAAETSDPSTATPTGGFRTYGAGAFDLLVANILAETLVEMHDSLIDAVRPGGTLVLSGIEARRLKMVEEAFIRPPWRLARTVAKGEWASISLHRDSLAGPDQEPTLRA